MSPSASHLQIIQDPKFYSRVLSKETTASSSSSASAPSFRVYYGVASCSVPFLWESQPGTPKHPKATSSSSSLPPLTPPPSSSYKNNLKSPKHQHNLFQFLLPKLRKSHPSSSSSSSSSGSHRRAQSSSTASSSFSSSSNSNSNSNSRPDEDEEGRLSPTSTLCFGMKRALLSFAGNGFGTRKEGFVAS